MNDDARVKLRRKMSDHPRQDVLFSSRRIRLRRLQIRFLRPAWTLLQDKAVYQKWLVLLDEEPMDVMSEAVSYAR
jgi:hypothetical protein